jgi:glycosyltransferase involved in cell wall biosynthesis
VTKTLAPELGVSRDALRQLSVGVVIPCHNYAHFLADAITSVLEQTRRPDLVIVVDDSSTDGTPQVAERFSDSVRYLRIEAGGPSAARNVGALALDTDLVVFLDADDRLAPTFVERCVKALPEDWDRHFVYTHFRLFGNSEGVQSALPYDRTRLARSNFIHPASLFPRAEVARIGYDESLRIGLEDWDLYLTLAEEGIEGILVDEPLIFYRIHGDGVTVRLRRKPLRLFMLRMHLLVKHRALYDPSQSLRQVTDMVSLLITDTEERYEVRRRSTKAWQLLWRARKA